MNETYSLSLALVDFIPSIAFAAGAAFLIQLVWRECGKVCASLMLAGSVLVFLAGFFKALWKLLYAAEVANILILSELQFVLLAPGFVLMLISVVQLSRLGRKAPASALLVTPWKIPFLFVMVLSSLGIHGILTYTCFQRNTKWAAIGFIIAFLSVLAMGGMASAEQTISLQWIAESVNSLGQVGFAVGCYLLYRASTTQPAAPLAA
ncbi:MAG: hypothetical protein CVU44_00085 [Chloroflexi bacterium HGW-Chloroflexi-6]|nr:MAG: hypothetical protein CVU44_00085 [Chloroflexi bacterium HGW-Chloroflexi-6]